jgi:hypothetical protein
VLCAAKLRWQVGPEQNAAVIAAAPLANACPPTSQRSPEPEVQAVENVARLPWPDWALPLA